MYVHTPVSDGEWVPFVVTSYILYEVNLERGRGVWVGVDFRNTKKSKKSCTVRPINDE